MRVLLPTSHGRFRRRLSIFDASWAALCPLIALYLRGAYILSPKDAPMVVLYCGTSLAFSLIAFLAFHIGDDDSHHFSVQSALNVVKAVFTAGFMTALVLFTFTRLDGIPRSTPIIHVLILTGGLIVLRALARFRGTANALATNPNNSVVEHIILIGATQLSSLYIKFVSGYSPFNYRIIAVLDDKSSAHALNGVPITANVGNLERTIDEFAIHGIHVDRLIVGGDQNFLADEALAEVRRICVQHQIQFGFVADLIGLNNVSTIHKEFAADIVAPPLSVAAIPTYHRVRRVIDFFLATATILALLPLFGLVSLLILLDVGSPILFWQQRFGHRGGLFLLYKFRTLRAPFDSDGRPLTDDERLSWVGRILRDMRLDELPQLINVLVGDMSLIGPRPLLLRDQPTNSKLRLLVRPGITGWAQVNGGNSVNNNEKGALDEWYIRNASPWIDLRIIGLTILFLFKGERRDEHALSQAQAEQKAHYSWMSPPQPHQSVREVLEPVHTRKPAKTERRGANPPGPRRPTGSIKPHQ